MRKVKQLTFNDYRMTTGEHGGPRPRAGRPTGKGSEVPHFKRPIFKEAEPGHVTIRLRKGLSSMRRKKFIREFRRSLREILTREDFRVVVYSIQSNHLHMIVEAADSDALASGMKAIASRLARAFNRVFHRSGKVLDGRYHLRVLKSPREVRNALSYVLFNHHQHHCEYQGFAPPVQIHPASSGRWFGGFLCVAPILDWSLEPDDFLGAGLCEVSPAQSWLLCVGWMRGGLIDPAEVPGGKKRRAA